MRARLLLGVIALLVAAGLAFLWWSSDTEGGGGEREGTTVPAAAPRAEADLEGEPPPAADAGRGAGRSPLAVKPGDVFAAALHPAVVGGRVVDGRRFPVAGATIVVERFGEPAARGTSDAEGRYRIPGIPRPPDEGVLGFVRATDARGRVGFRTCRIPPWDEDEGAADVEPVEVRIDVLVLEEAHDVSVRVLHRGRALPGARVSAGAPAFVAGDLAVATSDERGLAVLAGLPATWLCFEAAAPGLHGEVFETIPDPEGRELLIEVAALRTVEVRVLDSDTGEGVAAARVTARRQLRVPVHGSDLSTHPGMIGEYGTEASGGERETTTDGEGRAILDALPAGGSFRVLAARAGYHDPGSPWSEGKMLRPGATSLTLELQPERRRTVRWPLVAGEVPPPPAGTALALRPGPQSFFRDRKADRPSVGYVGDGHVVVEGVPARWLSFLALTSGGDIASFDAPEEGELGDEVAFRRARTVEVVVHDSAGAPVPGAVARVRNQGNNPLGEKAITDAEGEARIAELYGGRAEVRLVRPGETGWGKVVGTVDLEAGDARLEVTLDPVPASPPEALLRVRLEGEPGLPARFLLGMGSRMVEPLGEDPARGELRLSLADQDDGPIGVGMRAEGYLYARTVLRVPPGGSRPEGTLDLERARTLTATAVPPEDGRVTLQPQCWDTVRESWVKAGFGQRMSLPNGPRGSYVFRGLASGRYRVLETRSKLVSTEVALEGEVHEASVHLDLGANGSVTGRLEAPPGTDLTRCKVLLEGEGVAADAVEFLPGFEPPRGAWVRADGTFELHVTGGRPLTLRPWHPWLTPAAEGGTVGIDGPRDGVVLRLEAGHEVRIPLLRIASERRPRSVRVFRYADEAVGAPLAIHHAPVADGAARFGAVPEGTWTLWIDPGRDYAPLVRRGVKVGPGVTVLSDPRFRAGSTVRIHVLVPEDQDPPRIYAAAQSLAAPVLFRDLNSDGEAEVLLRGLGAGRYSLRLGRVMSYDESPTQEIEVDGITDLDVTLDLR